jgi:hypothetical protein
MDIVTIFTEELNYYRARHRGYPKTCFVCPEQYEELLISLCTNGDSYWEGIEILEDENLVEDEIKFSARHSR